MILSQVARRNKSPIQKVMSRYEFGPGAAVQSIERWLPAIKIFGSNPFQYHSNSEIDCWIINGSQQKFFVVL